MLNKTLLSLSLILFISLIVFNLFVKGERYTMLAEAALNGKTYFLTEPSYGWVDTVELGGKHYWPSGPLPIIAVLPFVVIAKSFGFFFYHGYLQPFLVLAIFLLIRKIALKFDYSSDDALFLAFGFIFSTVFMNVGFWPEAWGFVQVIATVILFYLLYAYIKKFPLWNVGVGAGLLLLTRPTASLVIFFFLATILLKKGIWTTKIKQLAILATHFIVALLFFGLYNNARFGNYFEQGYGMQIVSHPALFAAREHGLFNLIHLPGNVYYFLLSTPLPVYKDAVSQVLTFPFIRANPWGMSIIVTSPLFLYLAGLSFRDRLSKVMLLTIFVITIPVFLYYGIGWRQFGYRYSLDFLPLLYFLLIRNYKKTHVSLSGGFKMLILISAITNLYFFVTAYAIP